MKEIKNEQRRQLLKGSLLAVSATALVSGRVIASDVRPEAPTLASYKPVFFKEDEWRFILAACDRLIPADETGSGALDTNVPVFIDLQMDGDFGNAVDWYMKPPFIETIPELGYQSPLTPAQTYRLGIAATDKYCQSAHGKLFRDLTPEQQDEVLTKLEKGNVPADDVSTAQFFSFLLQNTKEGFFADPIHGGNRRMESWKMIGFPGARASFKEWVDQNDVAYPLGPVSISGERG
ncbi:MAG: gluconate 2-dehydrogenase [Oleibacter sp.]|nr:gluconate 2-dehydrogenase [Thalassolituus sp.]